MPIKTTIPTNPFGSPAFRKSIQKYSGATQPEPNVKLRIHGLVNQERMLIEDKTALRSLALIYTKDDDLIERTKLVDRKLSNVCFNIESARETYKTAVCRKACAAMYAQFPRKLRGMVYAYVTSEEVVVCKNIRPGEEDWSRSPPKPLSFELLAENWHMSPPCTSNDKTYTAHYWRDKAVKSEARAEMIESWYRNSTFNLELPKYLRKYTYAVSVFVYLPFILEHDSFRLGFKPRELIHKIVTVVELPSTGTDNYGCILEDLEQIFLLRNRATVHLRLKLNVPILRFTDDASALQSWLVYVHPVLLKFKRAGYILIVSLDEIVPAGPVEYIEQNTRSWRVAARLVALQCSMNAYTQILNEWMKNLEDEAKREVYATS